MDGVEIGTPFVEDEPVIDGWTEFEQTKDAFLALGNAIAEQLTGAFEQLGSAMQTLYNIFWETYRNAGSPYGDTDDGLLRWAKEVSEAQRMKMEAERILTHHQMLADFRAKVQSTSQPTKKAVRLSQFTNRPVPLFPLLPTPAPKECYYVYHIPPSAIAHTNHGNMAIFVQVLNPANTPRKE